jgi:hypothetical protein
VPVGGVLVVVGTMVPEGIVSVAVGTAVPPVVADGLGEGRPVGVTVGKGTGVLVGIILVGGGGGVGEMKGRKRRRPANILVSERQLACIMA